MKLNSQLLSFDGPLLERGFWLYVWEVLSDKEAIYYVGRTGDSSSANASSPFNRVGNHFDIRPNAKGNSLIKRLRERGIQPETCTYRMIAVGPIFSEQPTFDMHRPYRDIVATLEHALAENLRSRGMLVVGTHHPSAALDKKLFEQILNEVDESFFNNRTG